MFLISSPAAQGVHSRTQATHRQAAENRTSAGRAQPAGRCECDAALRRCRETVPGHQRGGQRSCYSTR